MESYDVAVIGGGASGLAAAVAASREAERIDRKVKIAVMEKNPRVGKKLLMTGNGRCNLTNLHAGPDSYHGDTAAAAGIFNRFTPEKILEEFRSLGLLCRELEEGRVYPYSLQASSVLNILRRRLDCAKVQTVCDFPAERIEKSGGGFIVRAGSNSVAARKVIVAAGGKACPQSGSDGSGYALLKPFGHTVTALYPALVQVKTDPKRVKPLKGVRSMAAAMLIDGNKTLASTRGEVQFTENALSGICIFELSRFAAEASKQLEISLDLAPEFSADDLCGYLRKVCRISADLPCAQILEGFLNKSLGAEIVKTALKGLSTPSGALTENDIFLISNAVKDFRFPATGTMPWQNAQVTAGGIPLAEADSSLQSKFCKGIYLCGELLNIDGGCGGFNLQWAWASGFTAGTAAANVL